MSPYCTSGFTIDNMLGAMTCFISCPEYLEEANLEELIAGNAEEGFKQIYGPGPIHTAWVDIFNHIDTALSQGEFSLIKHYKLSTQDECPSLGLAQWCEGYIKGTQLTYSIWQEDFNLLDSIPHFRKGANLAKECDATLNLVAMFADWQKALELNENAHELKAQVMKICSSIELGVGLFYQLGCALSEIKLDVSDCDFELFEIDDVEFDLSEFEGV
ncbi:UPF0149 family protein [Pseudoalteromonas denitrificans]|uniref:YecA family protein n=1 Tax=Pseudoalteromonas denitrificans DSM 6059 TaxID=1123010 RepID=A0A1I1NUG5_9GAMM|nr:UPF0149 family protein [Pseudoalteromonas denitrificans]SFD01065.1 yecA family protein [Pseudoalteromonas denitrificans DSM 6059]